MNTYLDQLKLREESDREQFLKSMEILRDSVNGKGFQFGTAFADEEGINDALNAILKYYGFPAVSIPSELKTLDRQLEFALRPLGFMWREVKLSENWMKDSAGAMIGRLSDGELVVLLPRNGSGYNMFIPKTSQVVKLTKAGARELEGEALCFYKPLPEGMLGIKDFTKYMASLITGVDVLRLLLANLLIVLVGLIPTWGNQIIFGQIVGFGNSALPAVGCLLLGAVISSAMFQLMKTFISTRITMKIETFAEAAVIARVISMPMEFFSEDSSGTLASKVACVESFCEGLLTLIIDYGLAAVFSLVYIIQIATFAPQMVGACIALVLVSTLCTGLISYWKTKQDIRIKKAEAESFGMQYALISGIEKLRLAYAERRGFAKWAEKYAAAVRLTHSAPFYTRLSTALSAFISMGSTIIIYIVAVRSGMNSADYMAFSVAFGGVASAFLILAETAPMISDVNSDMEMIKPILKAVPEYSENSDFVGKLSGSISFENVSFKYAPEGRTIVDDLTLKINPGQYVAIVGKSGCGKSTLMKLMLGFLKPTFGSIYYDGKDIKNLDPISFRKRIGVVEQDGKLFSGPIVDNIRVTNPGLTLDEAWEAAEIAQIADSIRQMPMGMHTLLSEGGGGVSGGQRQRLLIARAIAGKPNILMLDEATSALDNITQRKISDSLETLKCTRIVIAHRLSTIRQCDRIIYLEDGKILEDGTYDELMELKGRFYDLVERQRVDREQE